jgi:hypothetical protein
MHNLVFAFKRSKIRWVSGLFRCSSSQLEPEKWVKFKEWKNAVEAEKMINYVIDLYNKRMALKFRDKLNQKIKAVCVKSSFVPTCVVELSSSRSFVEFELWV